MSGQKLLAVTDLPESGIDASAAFFVDHLSNARRLLEKAETTSLVIQLPPADHSHKDWRLALARDLAREFAPKRANVAAGVAGKALDQMVNYLSDANGVTGHYLETHE